MIDFESGVTGGRKTEDNWWGLTFQGSHFQVTFGPSLHSQYLAQNKAGKWELWFDLSRGSEREIRS